MVEDSGVFTPEEIAAVDNHFLRTLIAHQNAYWRCRKAVRTVGGRHHTAGTSSFHLMVMHLLRCGTANDAAKELLLRWKKETEENLHSVAKHAHNPHDSATALDAISDTYWYCLEFGDLEFFTSGTARGTVDYSLMCWDNMGYAAGIDGYEAATPGYVRTGRGIGLPLAPVEGDMNGLRIGTPELARWGVTVDDIPAIADLVARALKSGNPETLAAETKALRAKFNRVHFVCD